MCDVLRGKCISRRGADCFSFCDGFSRLSGLVEVSIGCFKSQRQGWKDLQFLAEPTKKIAAGRAYLGKVLIAGTQIALPNSFNVPCLKVQIWPRTLVSPVSQLGR